MCLLVYAWKKKNLKTVQPFWIQLLYTSPPQDLFDSFDNFADLD